MDSIIEYLLPIIIILAYVLPKLKGKKQKANPWDKTKKKKPGLISRLITKLEESARKQQGPQQSIDTRPDPFSTQGSDLKLDFNTEAPQPQPKPKVVKPAVSKTSEAPVAKKSQPLPEQVVCPQKDRKRLCKDWLKPTKNDLRKAIVWKEILGPPVALKDE